MPLSGKAVDLAGKPSKVGGTVAGVLGWVVLILGLSLALLFGLLLAWIFPATIAPWVVSLPIAFGSVATSLLLLLGGRKLREHGTAAERDARGQALFAVAQNRGGTVTARDAAGALSVSVEQADALLTDLAKTRPEEVGVEVSDQGEILYVFPGFMQRPRARVADGAGQGGQVRVGAPFGPEAEAEAEAEAQAVEESRQVGGRKEQGR
ncbi:hypothetical protein [Chondromyces apiculatus]|uniref:hypothetical protein n=1 Tax=Chondromyces apiculatus TaxID=51 RepID=UPI0018CC2DE3|nr:hypothetical protein [Chondromyces apiculatus]